MIRFTCNICGQPQQCSKDLFARDSKSCSSCGSTVRFRALMHLLSVELLGVELTLAEFPRLKSIRGLGLSDWEGYAETLAEKFSYTNTFRFADPQLDIRSPGPAHAGLYDFIIAADVFEHVEPPVERAFSEAWRLLKPHGVLFLTVPYSLETATDEHFPELFEYTLAEIDGSPILVNRTRGGRLEVFDNLIFHGGPGSMVEMRVFGEAALKEMLLAAGFREVEICSRCYPPHGVVFREGWGLPVVARKEPLAHARPWMAEMIHRMQELREFRDRLEEAESVARERTAWAQRLDREIDEARRRIVELQDEVEERNRWALSLEWEIARLTTDLRILRQQLEAARSSRWLKLGRTFGLGPRLTGDR
jgi:SAM-dependent methyltransferase